jgi:hypothetical protein
MMTVHRVEVEDSRYALLKYVATRKGTTPKKIIEEWITKDIAPEADRLILEALK